MVMNDVMKLCTVAAPGDNQTDQSESEEFGTYKKKKKKKKLGRIDSPSLTHTDRLALFAVCSSDDKIIASSYADAGFSYAADSGSIYCSVCGLTLFGFIRCDIGTYGDPLSLHRAHRPDCAFLTTKKWHQDTTEGQGKQVKNCISDLRFYVVLVSRFCSCSWWKWKSIS